MQNKNKFFEKSNITCLSWQVNCRIDDRLLVNLRNELIKERLEVSHKEKANGIGLSAKMIRRIS